MIQIKIGSAPGNNILLNHPSVSPFHLEIVRDDNGNFLLTDLNTMYGTTVNGYRIQGMVQLRATDIVKAGELVLPWNSYFLYQAPVAAAPNFYTPPAAITQQPAYNNPVNTPVKPRSTKKILMFVGGGALAAILILIALVYFYTRPSYAHLKLIPSDAFIITSVNFRSIAGKIDLDKMQELDFYRSIKKEAQGESSALSKAMSDPMSSGIDIFSQPYAFVTVENAEYARYTGGIVFAVKSESNFRDFILRLAKDDETIKQSDEFSLIRLDNGSCIAWDNNAGIILFSDRSKSRSENYCRTLFEQSEKESIRSIESFNKFKEANYDIGFYLNYDALRGIKGITIPAYMNGSASMATITFNEGKISYTSEYLASDKDTNAAQSFLGKKGINTTLKAAIPGKSYGLVSGSFDMNEIYKYMDKEKGMRKVMDEIAGNMMMDRKKLPGVLTGEFFFSLADVKEMPVSRMDYNYNYELDTYEFIQKTDTTLMPAYIFGVTVKDVTQIEAMLGRMELKDTLNGVRYWPNYRRGNYYFMHSGANYYLTNDLSLAASLSGGKAPVQVNEPMASLISNDPVYSYFNLNLSKYPDALPVYLEDKMGRRDFADFETVMNMFDYAELIGDGTKQTLDIYLVDKKQNCLNTFLQTGNELYLNHKN